MTNAPMGVGDRYYVYRSLLDLTQKFERRASREAEKAELHEWRKWATVLPLASVGAFYRDYWEA